MSALIVPASSAPSAYALTAPGREALERLTATCGQRLAEKLDGWRPHDHEELTVLVATFSREYLVDAAVVRVEVRAERAGTLTR